MMRPSITPRTISKFTVEFPAFRFRANPAATHPRKSVFESFRDPQRAGRGEIIIFSTGSVYSYTFSKTLFHGGVGQVWLSDFSVAVTTLELVYNFPFPCVELFIFNTRLLLEIFGIGNKTYRL